MQPENSNFKSVYNCLDLFYFINYVAISVSLYILNSNFDTSHNKMMDINVGILVSLYGTLLVVTILYHTSVTTIKGGQHV